MSCVVRRAGLRRDGRVRRLRFLTDDSIEVAEPINPALAEKRYRAGQTGYLESIDAQRELLSVQRQAVQLRGSRATATVALIRALAGGWDVSR